MPKQWRITVTVDQELYSQLEERAKKEARTLASLGKYLMLKGIESEANEPLATKQNEAA
ncbi:hypothetical protein NIES4071_110020 (plasmid) [Calothrix sp. NIES-4071]|nr:hypothetical protein NIES4071_110020 [Calothrix sp. NIES-4071]BAZ65263.1 hypothetical protein NIES4105_109960 [Calothrix sp. NIES-4105]